MPAATTQTTQVQSDGRPVKTYDSQGLLASGVVRATAGTVLTITALNTSASTRYLQLFNTTSVPADTAVPYHCPIKVGAGESVCYALDEGLAFGTGICWATSSTAATKTVGAAEMWISVRYL